MDRNPREPLSDKALLERLLNEPTVSVPDAAQLLGVGRSTMYAAAHSDEIPAVRIGNRVRIPTIWLRRLLQIQPDSKTDTE
ncbi:helix-turn-helix domain-containing protein [Nocardia sp. CA2R105]|uniref:helix-turn-helix domain-containing protein n=1 Tax=Nocardia coffeae TaxID=2873381 RepID=UPI001CA66A42|nr:helix-turn-helix domain-containing protein [Nocardia coffeae]MBY8858594.1 helix-turn-helix domain-containing protein [Nocardia coffeae]